MARPKASAPTAGDKGSNDAPAPAGPVKVKRKWPKPGEVPEPAIETDPLYADAPTAAAYDGHVELKRLSACCVEVHMGGWHFRISSLDPLTVSADHDDGRKLPKG